MHERRRHDPVRHLVLVGLMGSGKSTVGPLAAARLGRRFVDADVSIAEVAWESIPELFARRGEDEFRRLETRVLVDLFAEPDALVIATGGGVVEREVNRTLLSQADVVWLRAEPGTLVERVGGGDGRPLLAEGEPAVVLATLAERRYGWYHEVAGLTIDVDAISPAEAAERIVSWVGAPVPR